MLQHPTDSFGDLLRHYRKAAGLTQEGLAERAGLSVHGIQKLEQGVTHPYRDTAQRLASVLQLSSESEDLFRAAAQPERRRGSAPRRAQSGQIHSNLPIALSSFIGRDQELADVVARLEGVRLLTLTGVGGCGKSRLAIEAARALVPKYPDGVWLVELGPLSDATLVAQEVGAVLGIRETPDQPLTTALTRALAGRRVLLLLDNCEHLLQACAELLDALLRGCPALHVLATSREPVGIEGEVAWRVPSLSVPDPEHAASPQEGPCECDLYLRCSKFFTTSEYAPRLRARLACEQQLIDDAVERGWPREVERHTAISRRLCELLADLGELIDPALQAASAG